MGFGRPSNHRHSGFTVTTFRTSQNSGFPMQSTPKLPLKFAFYVLDADGNEKSLSFSKWGLFDGATLTLHQESIPASSVTGVQRRFNRLTISTLLQFDIVKLHYLAVTSTRQAEQLKVALDGFLSRRLADQNRETLREFGRSYCYREAECSNCAATILLSDMPETPQVYCSYCDTLTTVRSSSVIPSNEHEFRICESCNLFGQLQAFRIRYFWCAIVVSGATFGGRYCCRVCMRGEGWRMLIYNLPFLLAVPNAIWQLARCYNGSMSGGEFRDLDDGNVKLSRGDLDGASVHYRDILERVPHSAGVKFNLGQGLLMRNDFANAASAFEAALQDCVNYIPAWTRLRMAYHHLGEEEKLKTLDSMWSNGISEERTISK